MGVSLPSRPVQLCLCLVAFSLLSIPLCLFTFFRGCYVSEWLAGAAQNVAMSMVVLLWIHTLVAAGVTLRIKAREATGASTLHSMEEAFYNLSWILACIYGAGLLAIALL